MLKKEKKANCSKPEAPAPMSTEATPKETDEMAVLIGELAKLNINDEKYLAKYFHVTIHAPQMVQFFRKPTTCSSVIEAPILAPATCQSWLLMLRSVNTHLMILHKPTWIECLDSCPKLANSRGLSEALIVPRLVSLLW